METTILNNEQEVHLLSLIAEDFIVNNWENSKESNEQHLQHAAKMFNYNFEQKEVDRLVNKLHLLIEEIRKVAGPESKEVGTQTPEAKPAGEVPFQPTPITYKPQQTAQNLATSTHSISPEIPTTSGPLAVESLLKTGTPYPVNVSSPSVLYDDVTKHAKDQCEAIKHPRKIRCAIMATARDLDGFSRSPNFDDKFKQAVEDLKIKDFGKAEDKIKGDDQNRGQELKKREDEAIQKIKADIEQYKKEIVKAKQDLILLKTAQSNKILEAEKEANELKDFVTSLEDSYRDQVMEEERIAKEKERIANEKERAARKEARIAKEMERIAKEKERIAKEKTEATNTLPPAPVLPKPVQLPPIHEQPKLAEPLPNIPLGKPGDALLQEEKKMKETQSNPGEVIQNMHKYLING